jgi:hypothetical protein
VSHLSVGFKDSVIVIIVTALNLILIIRPFAVALLNATHACQQNVSRFFLPAYIRTPERFIETMKNYSGQCRAYL